MIARLLGSLLPLLTPDAGPPVLSAGEAAQAVLLVLSPRGVLPPISRSAWLDLFAAPLSATAVRLRSSEQVGLDADELAACPPERRLSCWVRALEAKGGRPRYLLALAVHPLGDRRIRAFLRAIDVEAALSQRPADGEQWERAVDRAAPQSAPVELSTDPEELRRYVAALVEELRRTVLSARGDAGGLAAIELSGASGLELEGRLLAEATGGRLRVVELRPGRRKARLRDGAGARELMLELRPGVILDLSPGPAAPLAEPSSPWRLGLGLGGGAAALAGGGLLLAGALRAASLEGVCLTRDAASERCPAAALGLGAEAADGALDGGAPLFLSLGTGLVLAGAGALGLALGLEEADDLPLYLGLPLLAGGLGFVALELGAGR